MARPLALRGRFCSCVGSAGRVFTAGVATLDLGMAACDVRLPELLDTSARLLFTRRTAWFPPRSDSDRRVFGRCARACMAYAPFISQVSRVRIDPQPASRDHGNHSTARPRSLRPRRALTRNHLDCPLMA